MVISNIQPPLFFSLAFADAGSSALSGNPDPVGNLSDSDDTRALLLALTSASYEKNVGHAGTTMRFLTAYFAITPGKVLLTGSERMKERPIGPLVEALRKLGADITYKEKDGFPPLEINGKKLPGGEISIKSNVSSQFISALLMIAPRLENGLKIHLEGEQVSASYIRMTLELMRQYGADYLWVGNTIEVRPGTYSKGEYMVESDWSGASYWYSLALLDVMHAIALSSLHKDSLQGDSALADLFFSLGIVSEFEEDRVVLKKIANIHPGIFSYDFTNCPDIVQSMAVALCMANIPFHFTGTTTLRIKETDRIFALQEELKKLGFFLDSDPAGSFLSWERKVCEPEKAPLISTYHDHRMAMAFAPAAHLLGEISIDDPMVVTKSYPGYWEDMKNAGFQIEEI